jgi:hypothetical protein
MSYVATYCVCCRRTLTDPLSISFGMGPKCRKNHGFDQVDSNADWALVFRALGAVCPAEVYDAVVNAHGVRKGNEPLEIDTTVLDAVKATRVLVHRLAVALDARDTSEQVIRYVAAISALGRLHLARCLVRGFMKRRDFRQAFDLRLVDVVRVYEADVPGMQPVPTADRKTSSFTIAAKYDSQLVSQLRNLPERSFDRETKNWSVPASFEAFLQAALKIAGMDLVASEKGAAIGRKLAEPSAPAHEWWDEPCRDDELTIWGDRETGAMVRYAIDGEPVTRPGLVKLPAVFYGHRLGAAS